MLNAKWKKMIPLTITKSPPTPPIIHENPESNKSITLLTKKIYNELGITSSTLFMLGFDSKSHLIFPGKRLILFEQLHSCHLVLNFRRYVDPKVREDLKKCTKNKLKSIFYDRAQSGQKFDELAEDLLQLMTDIPNKRSTDPKQYPLQAAELMLALQYDQKHRYNPNEYTGSQENGERSGQGTYTFANGGSYTGNWKNDVRSGQGTYSLASWGSYTGNWESDVRSGQGIMRYANLDSYTGNWENDVRSGQGTYTFANGASYTGNWENNTLSGQGIMRYANGDSYTGNWENGVRSGQGTCTFANGDSYTGNWENGLHSGQGTYTLANGDSYTGNWESGLRSGQGTYTLANGDSYTGNWKNGVIQGSGTLTYCCSGNRISISSCNWNGGYLPVDQIPISSLPLIENPDQVIRNAMIEFTELLQSNIGQQLPYTVAPEIFPGMQKSRLAMTVAIDPILSKHDYGRRRPYDPRMFDNDVRANPCNSSKSYLDGFFKCTRVLAYCSVKELSISLLKTALSNAFPEGYVKLNIGGDIGNPFGPASRYYNLDCKEYTIAQAITYGLFYPPDNVLPYSQCFCRDFSCIVPRYQTDQEIHEAFEKYKVSFLKYVEDAKEDKTKIKVAILLFISQIECSHFFNNGNNRLSCQILLNKLLVKYEVYDDKLGAILFIPNGFSHYVLSHLNYYLQINKKQLSECTVENLEHYLAAPIKWVDFGHECYQRVVAAEAKKPGVL